MGKKFVMMVGSTAFAALAAWLLFISDKEIVALGGGVVSLYIVFGIGRAVFEGTNKAVVADFFPHDKEAAFSNVIVQSGGSAAIAFVLFPEFSREVKTSITLASAVVSLFTNRLAFKSHESTEYSNLPVLSDTQIQSLNVQK